MPNKEKKIYFKVGLPPEMVDAFTAWVVDAGGKYEQLSPPTFKLPNPELTSLNQPILMGELRLAVSEYLAEIIPVDDSFNSRVTKIIGKLKDLEAIENPDGEKVSRFRIYPWEEETYTLNLDAVRDILKYESIDDYPKKIRYADGLGSKRYEQIRESLKHLLLKRQNGFVYDQPAKALNAHEFYSIRTITLNELADFMESQGIEERKITHLVKALQWGAWYSQPEDGGSASFHSVREERDNYNVVEPILVEAILTTGKLSQMEVFLVKKINKRFRIDRFSEANFTLLKQTLEKMLAK